MTDIWNLPSNISSIYIGQKEIQSIVQTSDSTVLYQKPSSHTYLLTAQLSQSTIYTDGSTVISGVLTDNGSAMSGETITIYDGNTSLGTCTTDSNGAYSKTLSGFNSGSHTLKASHTNVDSSTVSLTVNNHTYAISVSANPTTITSGQSSIISATLTKDSSAYSGQTVTFTYGGNSYTSTTDTNGVATYTYTGTGVGSVTITASSNNVNDTVTITDRQSGGSTPSSISISATKDTLSAYDSESSVLTVIVLDSSNNTCSGETVTFKKGSTVLGTDTTDANGEAEYTYSATGVGDVTLTIECSSLTETYTVKDCTFADDVSTNKLADYVSIKGSSSLSYNVGHLTISSSSGDYHNWRLPCSINTGDNYIFELKIKRTRNNSFNYITTVLSQKNNSSNYISNMLYPQSFGSYGYGSPNKWLVPQNNGYSNRYANNTEYTMRWTIVNGISYHTIFSTDGTVLDNHRTPLPSNYSNVDVYHCLSTYADNLCEIRDIQLYPISFDNNLTITSSKEHLSYADNESCILTASLSGDNNNHKLIQFFDLGTGILIGSAYTNSQGVATYEYSSQGLGELNIYAKYDNILSEPIELIDAKIYISNNELSTKCSATPYNNDRVIYASNYNISLGDKIHFRVKNSVPSKLIFGMGSTAGADYVLIKENSSYSYYRSVTSNSGSLSSTYYGVNTTSDIVFEKFRKDSSTYQINIYRDSSYIDYWRCGNNINKIRIDKFNNIDYEIDVFVV